MSKGKTSYACPESPRQHLAGEGLKVRQYSNKVDRTDCNGRDDLLLERVACPNPQDLWGGWRKGRRKGKNPLSQSGHAQGRDETEVEADFIQGSSPWPTPPLGRRRGMTWRVLESK